ncbi:WD40-repeat-containing domain protein [Catenaria anguillulae PL171]|uniref:WD40-repeat-containing domain protein n=1 Tax=Catenaria anguillulae PL171 TaxID=765915 RepID=A0A1Y2H989_9FUNG|nr:WD40-repeat-containing domain protein [Catenaria anguillulae PL171]
MNRPRRSASTRIQRPAYPTGLFSDEEDPGPSRKRTAPDSDGPGSESDFNPEDAAVDEEPTDDDSDQIDETASHDEDDHHAADLDELAEDDDDLVIGRPGPSASSSSRRKSQHPSIMLPLQHTPDQGIPAPLVLAPVDPATIEVLPEHQAASEALVERIKQAILDKKALVHIQSAQSTSALGHNPEPDSQSSTNPPNPSSTSLVRMPVIVDGKFGCPICPFSGVTRSAFVGHLKHAVHPISAVVARLFPKSPLEPRSPLLGNLPDVHPLSTTDSSILELVLAIPVPLYPIQVSLGSLLLTTDIGEFLYESSAVLLGMPEFDPLSYLQLQPIFSRQDIPIYAHLKDLVAASVNEPRSKQSINVWQNNSRITLAGSEATNGDAEEPSTEATTWAMPKPRRAGRKSLKAAEAAGGPLDSLGPVSKRFTSEKHLYSSQLSRRLRHALDQLDAHATSKHQVVESCRAEDHARADATVELMFEGSKDPVRLELFASAAFGGKSSGYVINTGGSVWGTTWHSNFLAIGGYQNTIDYHVVGARCPGFGTIQVWDVTLENNSEPPQLVCCIHHDWGACFDLKWWPGSYHDNVEDSLRIGLLGGCFADGGFRLFSVPRVEKPGEHVALDRVVFEVLRPESNCLSFDWGGTEKLAIGFSNGFMSVYDVPFMLQGFQHALMTHFPAHDSFVSGVSFERGVNPHAPLQVMSCGSDGRFLVWDTRDLSAPLVLSRSRAFLRACEWSKDTHFLHFADTDHSVRTYRNPDIRASQVSLGHSGTIWALDSSPYHPFILSASGDGTVKMSNPFLSKVRGIKQSVTTVYSMECNAEGKRITYGSCLRSKELLPAVMRKEGGIVFRVDPRASIQACAWCDAPEFSGWLASGGRNGIVRIDNVSQKK